MKLAVLTNGRTWWLYLPLQAGSWEQRRFLTIDLEVQEPSVVERLFLEYLSRERVGSGQAVGDAEDLVDLVAAAWNRSSGPRLSAKPSPPPGPRSSKLPMNSWLT